MNTELKQKLNIAIAALTDIATNKDDTFDPRKEASRGLDAIRSLALENLEKYKANERIRELAEQAGFYYTDKTGFITPAGCDPAKFAELIVKKCIEQASIGNGHGNNQWDRALTFAVKNIKEHFGVEE